MNYIKIDKCDVANGQGVRVVLWLSGCSLHCKGCHNSETWDKNNGKLFDEVAKKELFDALSKSHIRGITFSGGHPLEEYNVMDVVNLIDEIRIKFPNKDIWLYTGLVYEDIVNNPMLYSTIKKCDVIVDGPYIEKLRNLTLPWRGSSNQRVIDINHTLSENRLVLFCE